MKKSLFAMAAVTAFAGAAQAQSSATVYGLLDTGYVGYNQRVSKDVEVDKTTSNKVVDKNTGKALSSSADSVFSLGFKGTEDLGGGTSALFTVELALTPNEQQTANSGSIKNSKTSVGLKKDGIGQFALGTQHTVVHQAVAVTDPGNTNKILGNLIYSAQNSSPTDDAYTVRTNNQLSLNSATFAGFKANAMLVANSKNENNIVTETALKKTTSNFVKHNQKGWGLGLDYTWNKLYATVNYQTLRSKDSKQASVNGILQNKEGFPASNEAASLSLANGTNVRNNQLYAAATYDFGILKAYAQHINRKVSEQQNSGYYFKRSAEQIGVRSFITPTVEAWASGGFGRHKRNDTSPVNMRALQIGSNYWLSKRTNLYAIYGQEQARTFNKSAPAAKAKPDTNIRNYAIGIRHTF
jgi:predicted porin